MDIKLKLAWILCTFINTQPSTPKIVKFGAFKYTVHQKKFLYKEEGGVNAVYNSYKLMGIQTAGGFQLMSRNDSVFCKGSVFFDPSTKLLKTKEIYYFSMARWRDSLITIFKQDKKGYFKYIKSTKYKNGKIVDTTH